MSDPRSLLERESRRFIQADGAFERLQRRRDRKRRNQRIQAGVLALAIAIAVGWLEVNAIRSTPRVPANDRSEELGIFAPVAGRIVYENEAEVGDLGYDLGLWAIDPSGPSDTTEGQSVAEDVASTLVRFPEDGTPLGWSSNGTELLLVRMEDYSEENMFPKGDLYILHADGSQTRLNSDPMDFGGAAISPDGSRVVFAADGLYVVDADGGEPVRIAEEGTSPTFSPDGTQIAYLGEGNDDEAHVWIVSADGTDAHEILADEPTLLGGVSGLRWSPAGDRLAFGIGGHKGADALAIYTFAPDGSDFTRVITGGESPYWSPDGSQIAYTILCDEHPHYPCPEGSILRSQYDAHPELFGGGSAGLAIADADGSNVREFGFAASGPWHPAGSLQADETTPTPSEGLLRANGEVLSFTGARSYQSFGDLVAVNPETGEERVLIANLSNVISAEWSADGRWVAYERFPLDSAAGEIQLWVVGASRMPRLIATGGNPDLFADGSVGWVWSRTGAELLTARLSSLNGDAQTIDRSRLSVVNVETGETTDLGSVDGGVGTDPAWSPDGTRIALATGNGSVYSVDLGSGERSLLARFPEMDHDPALSIDSIQWSPDGTHVSIVKDMGDAGERLYVMDADGSNVRLLTEGYELLLAAWSPDGTRLAFAEGFQAEGEVRILVAPMDGSDPAEIGSVAFVGCTYNYECRVTWSPDGSAIGFHKDKGEDSVIASDGSGEAEPIDDLTYQSWAGGSY